MFPIHEFVDEGLGHSSYLIDLGDGTAAVIDPPRFPTAHEEVATREGLRIAWAADTHSHADYVTGSPGLATRLGTTFIAPAASDLATPHQPSVDGDPIQLGNGHVLMPLATPGHTPDHHAYVLEHDGDPIGLFTGGSLMVGTVGRTDLDGPEATEPLAHEMFRSLRRFDNMPDDLAVYPTHGAGSFCGASTSSERTTTLGAERTSNPLFAIGDEDEFVEALLAGFGSIPSHFLRLPELNRLGPAFYDEPPPLERLTADQVAGHVAEGALIVDVRPVTHFGAGHIPGSMSNVLRPVFASWIGWLTEPDRPLVFVLDEDQERSDLIRQCLDVGVEYLLGELDGGIDAWVESGRPLAQIPIVDIDAIAPTVIDVRQDNEYKHGHVPGAINVELGSVATASPAAGPVTLMCGHGERAMTAASILNATGQTDVSVFDGGPDTWATATGRDLIDETSSADHVQIVTKPLLVGATAADPSNVVLIWNAIRRWFVEHGLPIEYALYSTYETMGKALLAGDLDIAWNAPMAHAQSLARSGGACRTLAMRDTDEDNHTLIVARADSGIATVDDLRGARLALGVDISSELYVIPVAQLRGQDLDPLTDCVLIELEPREYSDLQRWVDDFMIFDAVVAGDADAGAIFEPWLGHVIKERGFEESEFVEVWRSRPFSHCAFTARPGLEPAIADRFVDVLMSMDPEDHYVADMMKRENLQRWVKADDSGWDDLMAAVDEADLVGKTF